MAGSDFSRIATNIQALNALNSLNRVNEELGIRQLRLATGRRINSAADDAAGLTIATKFDLKAKGLGQALANIADAKSLMAVAEGHLNNINDILGVMRTKAEQAANDTLGESERTAILDELKKLNEQIDAEVSQARWGNSALFENTNVMFQVGYENNNNADELRFNIYEAAGTTFTSQALSVQAGTTDGAISGDVVESNPLLWTDSVTAATVTGTELASGAYKILVANSVSGTTQTINVQLVDWNNSVVFATSSSGTATDAYTLDMGNGLYLEITAGMGTADATMETKEYSLQYVHSGHDVGTHDAARNFMTSIDAAVSKVSSALSYIGAMVNRLDYQEASVNVAKVNTEAAYNRIMNADMAYEQVEATKYQILQQTATTMLAQANVQPQSILSLFR